MKTDDYLPKTFKQSSSRNYVLGIYVLFITTATIGYAAVTAWQTL